MDPRLQAYYGRLEALSRGRARAWSLIVEYVRETGERCFTYNELMRFWRGASTPINAQTLDRSIRHLAAEGLLERVEYRGRGGRRRTRFCLPEPLYKFYLEGPGRQES